MMGKEGRKEGRKKETDSLKETIFADWQKE
jgi:hypothetical protein